MKGYGIIIYAVIGIIIMSYIILNAKRDLDQSKNTYFYLKIKKLELKYQKYLLSKSIKKYPIIDEQINMVLKLIKDNDDFNLKQIKLDKPHIRKNTKDNELIKFNDYAIEFNKCDDELLELLHYSLDLKEEIVKYRFPIKHRLYKIFFMIELRILYIYAGLIYFIIDRIFKKRNKKRKTKTNIKMNKDVIKKMKDDDDFPPIDGVLLYAH